MRRGRTRRTPIAKVILIAEDEAPIRRLMKAALQSPDCEILEAADGPQALEISRNFDRPIDLLITDVKMPGMDGAELAGVLCRHRPALDVLYSSGFSDHEFGELKPCPSKERHYLPKPFTLTQLREAVIRIMGPI